MFYADFGLNTIARLDGPVATLPTISPANRSPVAVPGPDRIVEGNANLSATLTLDGSGSNDPSGSPLTYSWSGDCGTATGPKPVVSCPWHPHNTANTVKLIVNNGKTDSDPAFVKVTVVDTTPPTITSVRAPPPNSKGWTNHTVTVSFQCSDIVSGISFVSDPVVLPGEGKNETANGYCTDGAGNIASKTVTDINIDKTPPTISGSRSPGPNANGWNNVDVTVHFECNDTLSGIVSCTPDVVLTNEGRNQSITGFAIDLPGNGAKTTVSGISIDKTPPVITSAQDGTAFILHQTVYADAHCSDALSGVDACVVPIGALDTSTVGQHFYTVAATDIAGNGAVLVVRYQVHYNFISVSLQPSGKGTQIGRTMPVRFQLTDALSSFVPTVTAQIWIDSQAYPGGSSGSANTGNYFRFDTSSNKYLFNLSTTGMTTGSHTVYITLDDGTVHAMVIGLTS